MRPVNFGPQTAARLLRLAGYKGNNFTPASSRHIGGGEPVVHFKSKAGGIGPINTTTGQMSSAMCDEYESDENGLLTPTGQDVEIYNAAGAFGELKFGIASYNKAGLRVAIVEMCDA